MNRLAYYASAATVVALSQLCGPRLVPWRPTLIDALMFLIAFTGAIALVAMGFRRKDPILAVIAVILQAALIRYQFVDRFAFGNADIPDTELLIENAFLVVCYTVPAALAGWGVAHALPKSSLSAAKEPRGT